MSDEMNNINVSIEEKRAPTDESVKILREMEEKVLNKILGSITLRFCEADLSFVYMFDVLNYALNFHIQYKLGNARQKVPFVYYLDHFNNKDYEHDLVEKLIKTVSDDIAIQLLKPQLREKLSKIKYELPK